MSRLVTFTSDSYLNVLKDILRRLVTGCIVPMVRKLALECPEEGFDAGVVPTIIFATRACRDAVGGE
jgi:hypothetical protein